MKLKAQAQVIRAQQSLTLNWTQENNCDNDEMIICEID